MDAEVALERYLHEHREASFMLLRRYVALNKRFLLRSELWDEFDAFCREHPETCLGDSPLRAAVKASQEAAVESPWIYLAVRPYVARWKYYRIHVESLQLEWIDASHYLEFKERLVSGARKTDAWTLEFDIGPFSREFPKLRESRSIGRGVEFLNRRLSSQLFQELGKGDQRLVDFLSVHQCQGKQLMVNDRIRE